MRPEPQCPECSESLELRDVSPCWDCGHDLVELVHLREDKHKYGVFRVFDHEIVLCDFCMVDFSSYHPEVFGLSPQTRIGLGSASFIELRAVADPAIEKDMVCVKCNHRLKFINWLLAVKT